MAKTSATIRDVARAAELSVASVSRVLNGKDNVHPDTRERVLEAVRALGYTPNAAARSLSTARTHALGVVLPDLHGEFFSELMRGIDRAASAHGYFPLLSSMHADGVLAGQAMAAMRGRVDGLLVMAPQLDAADLAAALPTGLPTVLVNCQGEDRHHAFRVDNRAGVRLMVEHLLACGRRNIVHIAGIEDNLDASERRDAFSEVMAELAPDQPARILQGDFQEATAGRLVQELLADDVPFDAIFAANDMMALGALQALREAGIDVPGRVAVAGFDDVPLARFLSLSTMRVDIDGLGARATERLIEEMEGRADAPAFERLTPGLMARGTTQASN
ncbi:LacI family DNA-binding transcriptional regulator [Stakelama sediminis]|uniref:LacI family transcriptional regulator n=1 Tax=Stakelama sediminis TaxID=463200 RepID=A0A840Z2M6_9SPHN|nr:LacI family transcriptional regulator [Stakelama sediminis]